MSGDKIECPGCERRVVPRLITNHGVPQRSVCPECAATIKNLGFAHVVLDSVRESIFKPMRKPIGNYLAGVGRRWDKLYGGKATADAPAQPGRAEKIAGAAEAAAGFLSAAFFTSNDEANDLDDWQDGGLRAFERSGIYTHKGLEYFLAHGGYDPTLSEIYFDKNKNES